MVTVFGDRYNDEYIKMEKNGTYGALGVLQGFHEGIRGFLR